LEGYPLDLGDDFTRCVPSVITEFSPDGTKSIWTRNVFQNVGEERIESGIRKLSVNLRPIPIHTHVLDARRRIDDREFRVNDLIRGELGPGIEGDGADRRLRIHDETEAKSDRKDVGPRDVPHEVPNFRIHISRAKENLVIHQFDVLRSSPRPPDPRRRLGVPLISLVDQSEVLDPTFRIRSRDHEIDPSPKNRGVGIPDITSLPQCRRIRAARDRPHDIRGGIRNRNDPLRREIGMVHRGNVNPLSLPV
jgi:hypothetical protein